MKLLTIINYKIGNQKSLEVFFKNLGYNTILTCEKDQINKAEVIILPGIGAFPNAMKSLKDNQLIDLIKTKAKKGTPIIGICLGMQILTSKSYEFEETLGLNLIPGKIKKLKNLNFNIGWNNIKKINKSVELWFSESDTFFFNHSYYYEGKNKYVIAKTNLKQNVPAIIKNKNIYGIQFHPEKSQESGKNLMINLLNTF
jgi:glutamine amidotransferase